MFPTPTSDPELRSMISKSKVSKVEEDLELDLERTSRQLWKELEIELGEPIEDPIPLTPIPSTHSHLKSSDPSRSPPSHDLFDDVFLSSPSLSIESLNTPHHTPSSSSSSFESLHPPSHPQHPILDSPIPSPLSKPVLSFPASSSSSSSSSTSDLDEPREIKGLHHHPSPQPEESMKSIASGLRSHLKSTPKPNRPMIPAPATLLNQLSIGTEVHQQIRSARIALRPTSHPSRLSQVSLSIREIFEPDDDDDDDHQVQSTPSLASIKLNDGSSVDEESFLTPSLDSIEIKDVGRILLGSGWVPLPLPPLPSPQLQSFIHQNTPQINLKSHQISNQALRNEIPLTSHLPQLQTPGSRSHHPFHSISQSKAQLATDRLLPTLSPLASTSTPHLSRGVIPVRRFLHSPHSRLSHSIPPSEASLLGQSTPLPPSPSSSSHILPRGVLPPRRLYSHHHTRGSHSISAVDLPRDCQPTGELPALPPSPSSSSHTLPRGVVVPSRRLYHHHTRASNSISAFDLSRDRQPTGELPALPPSPSSPSTPHLTRAVAPTRRFLHSQHTRASHSISSDPSPSTTTTPAPRATMTTRKRSASASVALLPPPPPPPHPPPSIPSPPPLKPRRSQPQFTRPPPPQSHLLPPLQPVHPPSPDRFKFHLGPAPSSSSHKKEEASSTSRSLLSKAWFDRHKALGRGFHHHLKTRSESLITPPAPLPGTGTTRSGFLLPLRSTRPSGLGHLGHRHAPGGGDGGEPKSMFED